MRWQSLFQCLPTLVWACICLLGFSACSWAKICSKSIIRERTARFIDVIPRLYCQLWASTFLRSKFFYWTIPDINVIKNKFKNVSFFDENFLVVLTWPVRDEFVGNKPKEMLRNVCFSENLVCFVFLLPPF